MPTPGDDAKVLYKEGVGHYRKYVELRGSGAAFTELAKACDSFAQSLRLQFDVKTIEGLGNCRSAQRNYVQAVNEISLAINKARRLLPPPIVAEARKTLNVLKERKAKGPPVTGPAPTSGACNGGSGAVQIIINEIGANEPGNDTAGEFVELFNAGAVAADLGGFTLADSNSMRHTFAAGTTLEPGKAIVVFGAPSGIPAGMPNAVAASSGGLSLANEGDSVTLADTTGAVRDSFTYPPSLAATGGVSMNRNPDGLACAPFVRHSAITPFPSTPGRRVSGATF